VHETSIGMGLSRRSELRCLLYECRAQLSSIMFVGFGRAIGEVGAVMLVGGNVQFKTRVMTTAIMLETNRGNFEFAIALGVVLLVVSFIINSIALTLQERVGGMRNQGASRARRRHRIVIPHISLHDDVAEVVETTVVTEANEMAEGTEADEMVEANEATETTEGSDEAGDAS